MLKKWTEFLNRSNISIYIHIYIIYRYRNEDIFTTTRCLALGGKGGFKSATSVRSQAAVDIGCTKGGSGGDGTFNGGSYLGGCTLWIVLFAVVPKIHRAMLSQQVQQTSDIPCLRPLCKVKKRVGLTKACT